MPTVAVAAEAAVVAEVVGTTDGGRDAQDPMTPAEDGKGPPLTLRYM
jgi:hypothetical protein